MPTNTQTPPAGTPGTAAPGTTDAAPTPGQTSAPGNDAGTTQTWEAWLATQGDDVKGLFEGHVKGLKSALDAERSQRSDLAKQLREATAKLSKDSEARPALEQLTAQMEAVQSRADFYEAAMQPEIGCVNPRLAFIAAQDSGAIDQRGRIHWDTIKTQFPELFKKPAAPAGHAGAGTGQTPPAKHGMNQFIRAATGRPT
jgi:hypothetical protein